jgi:hypothetical protein
LSHTVIVLVAMTSDPVYVVAREHGITPRSKMSTVHDGQPGPIGPAYALRAGLPPEAQPPFTAVCGAAVHEVEKRPWPPRGLWSAAACAECARRLR